MANSSRMTANQVVAYNLRVARTFRGLSQEQAAERLEPYLGARWSKSTFSTVERSVDGKRVKQFSADEIVAFARAFDLPIAWFFIPPEKDPWGRLPEIEPPAGLGENQLLTAEELVDRVVDTRSALPRIERLVSDFNRWWSDSVSAKLGVAAAELFHRRLWFFSMGKAYPTVSELEEVLERLDQLSPEEYEVQHRARDEGFREEMQAHLEAEKEMAEIEVEEEEQ